MTQRIHFISGLPRSGSTLLGAILRQNPRFWAGMSGPAASIFHSAMVEMSGRNQYSGFVSEAQRSAVLRSVVEAYHAAGTQADVVFDTNRSWCGAIGAIKSLWPHSKVIACVRDVGAVIDSIEHLIQTNALEPSGLFNYAASATVYQRVNTIASADGLVGQSLDYLKGAFFGGHADRLMLVQYESLVSHPCKVLKAIYEFIGETPFAHDFDNVVFEANDFDARVGTPGLHRVRKKVEAVNRRSSLPPDLARRFDADTFWREASLNRDNVLVV